MTPWQKYCCETRAEHFISDNYHNDKIDVWYLNLKAYHTKQYQVSQHDSSHLVNTILFTAWFLKLYIREQIFLKNIDKKDEMTLRQKHFHGREQTAPSSRGRMPMGRCSLGAIVTKLTINNLDSREH